jgi:hypothetical protein
MSTIKTHASRTAGRLKEAWNDMSYAQQRLLEIRLGLPREHPERAEINRLEALYRLRWPGRS